MNKGNRIFILVSLLVLLCSIVSIMSIVIYATELNNEDNSVSDDTLRLVNQDNDFVMSVGLNPIINNPVSDISVPVRVSFDNTDVLSYTVETDGLIATETTEDSMEYDITVTDEYGVFTIYATYPDDVVAQSSIYTYSNGYSVYLSEFSKENALVLRNMQKLTSRALMLS